MAYQYHHYEQQRALQPQTAGNPPGPPQPAAAPQPPFNWSQPSRPRSQQSLDRAAPGPATALWLPTLEGSPNGQLSSHPPSSFQQYPPFSHVSALLDSKQGHASMSDLPAYDGQHQQRIQHHPPQPTHPAQSWTGQQPQIFDTGLAGDYRTVRSPSLPSVYGDFASRPQLPNLSVPVCRPMGAVSGLSLSPVTCVPPTFFNYAPTPPMSAPPQQMSSTSAFTTVQLAPINVTAPSGLPSNLSLVSPGVTSAASSSSSSSIGLRRSTGNTRSDGTGPDRSSKQFKCDVCPQSFNRNHDLKRHKRIHLAIKPFPCGWCEKTFSRKDALRRHFLVRGCGKGQGQTQEASEAGISKAPGIVAIRQAIEEESRRQNCALPASAYPPPEESPPTSGSPSGSGSVVNSPDPPSSQQPFAQQPPPLSTQSSGESTTTTSSSDSIGMASTATSDEGFTSGFHSPIPSSAEWRLNSSESLTSTSSGNYSDAHAWAPMTLPPVMHQASPTASSAANDADLFQYIHSTPGEPSASPQQSADKYFATQPW